MSSNTMPKFPDDFNRKSCQKIIQNSEEELIGICRQNIYNLVIESSKRRQKLITYKFEDLTEKEKIIICGELLERFDKLDIIYIVSGRGNDIDNTYRKINQFTDFNALKTFISEQKMSGMVIDSFSLSLKN